MTEHDHQVKVLQFCHRHEDQRLQMIFAIPNGGHRSKPVAAKLKAEGVKPGVPDLFLPIAAHGFHGLWIELKAEGGRLSKEQAAWIDNLNQQGYMAVLCTGHEAATQTIESYING